MRGVPVARAQSVKMGACPVAARDCDLIDGRAEPLPHGDGQPARRPVREDLDAVGVAAFAELRVVEKDEQIGVGHLMEVTEPGRVIRLVDGDDHGSSAGAT